MPNHELLELADDVVVGGADKLGTLTVPELRQQLLLLPAVQEDGPALLAKAQARLAATREGNSHGQLSKLTLAKLKQVALRLKVPSEGVLKADLVTRLAPKLGKKWATLRSVLRKGQGFDEWVKKLR